MVPHRGDLSLRGKPEELRGQNLGERPERPAGGSGGMEGGKDGKTDGLISPEFYRTLPLVATAQKRGEGRGS